MMGMQIGLESLLRIWQKCSVSIEGARKKTAKATWVFVSLYTSECLHNCFVGELSVIVYYHIRHETVKKVKFTQAYVTNIRTKTTTFPPQVNIEVKEKIEFSSKCSYGNTCRNCRPIYNDG